MTQLKPYLVALSLAMLAACGSNEEPPVTDEAGADTQAAMLEMYLNFEVPDAAPDWTVVQEYIDLDAKWHEIDDEINAMDVPDEEKERRAEEERGEHPDIVDAQAAATAIVRLDGEHEKKRDAALFLIEHTPNANGAARSIMLGLKTMAAINDEFDGWPEALFNLDWAGPVGEIPEADEFFNDYERNVPDEPLARATARYYAASRQLQFANAVETPAADRRGHRQRGIDFATGLSKGVENEELIKRRRYTDDGEPIPFATLAEAEKDLLYNLNFLTVGNRIPNVTGIRFDGVEETIADFEGQAVLLDFWATWCSPCLAAIPKMTELVETLPEDEFEILSISVDEEIETVTEFQSRYPMDWANWHVGPEAELLQTWAVRGYPTYILIDHDGTVVARHFMLNDEFTSLIRATACGPTGTGSC